MQNYKLFYNNVRLLVARYEHGKQTETCLENCFLFHHSLNLTEIFSHFLASEQDVDLLYSTETEEKQIEMALRRFFVFERAAGGIVFKDNTLLRIFRFNRWDFPKGHVEAGETDTDAALREVSEETGMDELTIEKDLDYTYHIFKNKNDGFVLKETHWYQMRTASEKTLIPQTEEAILAAEWLPFSQRDSFTKNTYPALVELLNCLEQGKS